MTYIHDRNKITGNWTMDECLQQGMMTDRSENGLATGHYRLRLTNLLFAVLSFWRIALRSRDTWSFTILCCLLGFQIYKLIYAYKFGKLRKTNDGKWTLLSIHNRTAKTSIWYTSENVRIILLSWNLFCSTSTGFELTPLIIDILQHYILRIKPWITNLIRTMHF